MVRYTFIIDTVSNYIRLLTQNVFDLRICFLRVKALQLLIIPFFVLSKRVIKNLNTCSGRRNLKFGMELAHWAYQCSRARASN